MDLLHNLCTYAYGWIFHHSIFDPYVNNAYFVTLAIRHICVVYISLSWTLLLITTLSASHMKVSKDLVLIYVTHHLQLFGTRWIITILFIHAPPLTSDRPRHFSLSKTFLVLHCRIEPLLRARLDHFTAETPFSAFSAALEDSELLFTDQLCKEFVTRSFRN